MKGPRIVIEGQREHVRLLADRLIKPEDGLRPWRSVTTALYPWGMRMEFAPLGLNDGGRPERILISLRDFCSGCKHAGDCPGFGQARNARACADVEVSTLRRTIEARSQQLRFTYQPPAYGEEDLLYGLTRP